MKKRNRVVSLTIVCALLFAQVFGFAPAQAAEVGAITIIEQPAAMTTVIEGSIIGSLYIAAEVSPDGEPAYQWYQADDDADFSGTAVEGASGDKFPIPKDLTADTYYYYCVVSAEDADPVTSDMAVVTVANPNLLFHYRFKDADELEISTEQYGVKAVTASIQTGTGPKGGNCLNLVGGGNSNLRLNSSFSYRTAAFTFSFWVRPNASRSGTQYLLSSIPGDDWLILDASGNLNLYQFGSNDNNVLGQTIPNGQWTHIAVTRNGAGSSALRWYVNGEFVATSSGGSWSGTPNESSEFLFGAKFNTFAGGFQGGLAEVRFYGQTLTDAQVAAVYNLDVPSSIAITEQPAAITTVTQGQISGSLSVAAKGVNFPNSGLSYQWYAASTASGDGAPVAGATKPAFFIPETLAEGNYFYYCVISGEGLASVKSDVAIVIVKSWKPFLIVKHPSSVTANAGMSAKFSVLVNAQADGIEWTYNWQQSADGTTWTDAEGVSDEAAYITPVLTPAYNNYLYRCRIIAGDFSDVSGTAALTVAREWPSGTEPVYTDFGTDAAQLPDWKYVSNNNAFSSAGTPAVVDDPSAANGKALKLSCPSGTQQIYAAGLPNNVTDGEYAMRVKVARPEGDSATDEARFGLVFRHSSSSTYNHFNRSGPGWFAENGGGQYSSGMASEAVFTPGQWHTLRLVFVGKAVTFYFDGVKVVDNYTWSSFVDTAGGFGFRSWYALQEVYIDNLYAGPIRHDDDLPPEFSVETKRGEAFDYERDYTDGVTGTWLNANTYAACPSAIVDDAAAGGGKALKLEMPAANTLVVDAASSYTKEASYKLRVKSVPETPDATTAGNIALVTRYDSSTAYAAICYNADTSQWDVRDANNIDVVRAQIGRGPAMLPNTWYDIRVRYIDRTLKLYVTPDGGSETLVGSITVSAATYPMAAGIVGVGSMGGAKTLYIDSLNYTRYQGAQKPDPEPPVEPIIISSPEMTVEMDNRFPVPRSYAINGKTVLAQQELAYRLSINGENWWAEVEDYEADDVSVTYYVKAYEDKYGDPQNHVAFTFKYTVEGTTLPCEIRVTAEPKTKLYRFDIPDVVFVKFAGELGSGTAVNGNIRADGYVNSGGWNVMDDLQFTLAGRDPGTANFSTGFISDSNPSVNIAAGLLNDSTETPSRSRVYVTADDISDLTNLKPKAVSLTNGQWVYRGVADSAEFPNAEADFPPPESMNFRVMLTGDNNGDGEANWQDAANVYRQYAYVPTGGADIRDYYSYVAFNFNNLAQSPFLRTLDNAKVLYNYTDGFGQMILEKGFQAGGHDDAHPDVGNHIGAQSGGIEDFNTLIDEGKKYNLKIGVHVNVGEYILDAFFNPPVEYFYRNSSGYPNSAGWGWVDQAFYFDQSKDLISGELKKRFGMLKENAPGLDWVYVDIYSGADWRAKQVSKVLKDYGWTNATEFSGPMEQDVVWTHWGTDLYYPTSGNGTRIFRYLYNDTKDVFPATSAHVSKLLRGSSQPGLSSWQNRTSMEEGVRVFYNQNLPSKYMQYFPVWRWEENEITFGAPTDDNGVLYPEKAGARSVVDGNTTKIYAPDGTLVAIMDLSVSGNTLSNTSQSQIFIPWNPITEEKIYYWNPKTESARTTTWTLPESWADQTAVQVFKLTDNGRELVSAAFPVSAGGTLDLSALSSSTPYVIYKNEAVPEAFAGDFGAVEAGGGYIADPGFDTHSFAYWKTANESNVTYPLDNRWNGIMQVGAEASTITNEITGLTPDKFYTASIWLQIGSNASNTREVTLRVTDNYGTNASRLANKTAVANGDEPGKWKSGSGGSYPRMTRIEVKFKAGEDGKANFILEVAAGAPVVTFDDARVWEFLAEPADPPKGAYYFDDFENISEGLGPFVYVGGGGNNTHLADKAPPEINGYKTNQIENYVINGFWSLKVYQNATTIVRTTPNTLKLEPNTTYDVQFNYSTAASVYYIRALNGSGTQLARLDLAATGLPRNDPTPTGVATLTFTTPAGDGDCYLAVGTSGDPGSLHNNFLIIDDFAVYVDEPDPDEPAVTSVAMLVKNLVANCKANIPVQVETANITDEVVAVRFVNEDESFCFSAVANADGYALIKVTEAIPDGAYKIIASVDGKDSGEPFAVNMTPQTGLWEVEIGAAEGGLLLTFAADITFTGTVTVNNAALDKSRVELVGNRSLLLKDVTSYNTIVVSKVKYPDLFPSYSFTFTLK